MIFTRGGIGIFAIRGLLRAAPSKRAGGHRRGRVGGAMLLALVGGAAAGFAQPPVGIEARTGLVTMTSGRLELTIATRPGLNPRQLRDTRTGRTYADLDYAWPNGRFPELESDPVIKSEGGLSSVSLRGTLGLLEVVQTFTTSAAEPGSIAEVVELRNPSDRALDTSSFSCGFQKRLAEGSALSSDVASSRFCNIPYRR